MGPRRTRSGLQRDGTGTVAKMAFITKLLNPTAGIDPLLVEKHFRRKHGPDAYYGQK